MYKKIMMGCLAALLMFVLIIVGTYWYFAGNPLSSKGNIMQRMKTTDLLKGRTNIMVMGVDERVDDVGRSDTLMVFMIDPSTNTVDLLSIPRDTLVQIPGYGWDKINHAYPNGGHELTRATVEDLLGIKINYYALVDVKGFIGIIDAIDGIDIDVPQRMYYEDPWDDDGGLVIDFQPGMQHMNGKQAMQYVRYRDSEEADIGRIRRQQQFIRAVYEKMTSPFNLPNLPRITAVVAKMLRTDISLSEATPLVNTLRAAVKNGLKSAMVPGIPRYIGEISYWVPDIDATRELIASSQGGASSGFKLDTDNLRSMYTKANPPSSAEESDAKNKDKIKDKLKDKTKDPKKSPNLKTDDKKSPTDPQSINDPKVPGSTEKSGRSVTGVDWENKTLNVVLVKCTDNPGAMDKMTAILEARNMQVVATREGDIRATTGVVSATSNQVALNRLFRLPFANNLRTMKTGDASIDLVIFVGKDFN